MSEKRKRGSNYGIQAESVTAGAIAVGKGAKATQNIAGGTDLQALSAAIAELRETLARTDLPKDARDLLEEDVRAIAAESETTDFNADRIESTLKNLVSKVKLTGQFAQGAADLIEPLRKIAVAIGVTAATIGLL